MQIWSNYILVAKIATFVNNPVSKAQKLLDRFLTIPADFSWDELVSMLGHFGFAQLQEKGGSYRCFVLDKTLKIFLHKPHPGNIVKRYALKQVRDKLKEFGLI